VDFYNIKNDWNTHVKLMCELEDDINFFLTRPLSRRLCTLARKKCKGIEQLGKKIKKNIIRQRQDIKSDYS
jgi:hypothetical protein